MILGLLTGGILSGQSLIRAAELRNITSEYSKYISALNSFRDKYSAIPGDMRNAVKFWGAQIGATTDGADATCAALTTASTTTSTCNGNGDGIIDNSGYGTGYEQFRFWQHLANAGLIEGTYSGVLGSAGNFLYAIPGTNVPRGRISGSGWSATNWTTAGDAYWWVLTAQRMGNYFVFGGETTSSGTYVQTHAGILLPAEAWNIDLKLDDGKPGTGKTVSQNWSSTCTTAANSSDYTNAEYSVQGSSKGCSLMFPRAF